jgi:hypothetical protein
MDDARPEVPYVLLLDAEEAARLLEDAGLAFHVVETRAPRTETTAAGRLRVIRVRPDKTSDALELTVCRI